MQDEVVIRKDRSLLKFWVVVLILAVIVLTTMVINDYVKNGKESLWYGVCMIAVLLAFLIYFGKELRERKVMLIISNEGVDLRNKGLYTWESIKSFSTLEYDDSYLETLVLHIENNADVRFNVDGLEKKSKEIIELMLAYKGSSPAYYDGHFRK